MRTAIRLAGTMATIAAATLLVGTASAQDSDESTSERDGAARSVKSDHDRFVGSFAVGYMGQRWVPIATSPTFSDGHIISMDADEGAVDAPVIGMRYWLSNGLGIDAGVGFRTQGGSATWTRRERVPGNPNAEPVKYEFQKDDMSQTGFLFHAGLPLALDTHKHFVFEFIPEMNLGFSTGTLKDQRDQPPSQPTPPVGLRDIKLSGLRLDVGARVGGEVHFGFVGLPNLALQATVGLYFSMSKIKADGGGHAATNPNDASTQAPKATYQHTSTALTTTTFDNPWAIFQNTVSALYYF